MQLLALKEEEMGAWLESYLPGLGRLKEKVKAEGGDCGSLDILQMRLKENIDKSLYGDTKENQADRAEILAQLNKITRDLYNISFDEHCQSNRHIAIPVTVVMQDVTASTENTMSEIDEIVITSIDPPDVEQQTMDFFATVREYVTNLRENAQRAKGIFNDNANIGQEQCEDALSPFRTFDCSTFPEHNPSLFRAKVRVQHLNELVKELIDLCEICDDIDRPSRSNVKKIQGLIRTLNTLFSDSISVQTLLSTIDAEISAER